MSLIQEALEKAGKVPNAEPKKKPAALPSATLESIRAEEKILKKWMRPRWPWKMIAASVAIAVLALCLIFAGKKSKTATPVMLAGVSSISQLPQTSPAANAPKFVLTGITESNGAKLALINNQVVGIGDRLKEKAIVKQIQEKTAVLDLNGREIKLTL